MNILKFGTPLVGSSYKLQDLDEKCRTKQYLCAMKRFLVLFALLSALTCSCSGPVNVETAVGIVRVNFYTPGIVRVEKPIAGIPQGKDSSICVILQPQRVRRSVSKSGGQVTLSTDSLIVTIYLADGCINFEIKLPHNGFSDILTGDFVEEINKVATLLNGIKYTCKIQRYGNNINWFKSE